MTHPSPADEISSSVAAVVGSYDSEQCSFSASIRVQQRLKEEMIKDLDIMMIELLTVYHQRNNSHLPQQIIFYRDGVSEGQFNAVLEHEHKKLLDAFIKIGASYKPKVTFIIVQKRHHTR